MKKQTNLLAFVLLASITGLSFANNEELVWEDYNPLTEEEDNECIRWYRSKQKCADCLKKLRQKKSVPTPPKEGPPTQFQENQKSKNNDKVKTKGKKRPFDSTDLKKQSKSLKPVDTKSKAKHRKKEQSTDSKIGDSLKKALTERRRSIEPNEKDNLYDEEEQRDWS